MKRYWKTIVWSILFVLSVLALVLALVWDRPVQVVPSIVAMLFTAAFAIVEGKWAK